jgi:hypothetical protein
MAASPAIAAFNARRSNSGPPNLLDAPCTQDCLGNLTARGGLPSMEQDTARISGLQCVTRTESQE